MIAVMGAAGNVGSKVADMLLRRGEDVRVLQHLRGLEELGGRGAEVITGDATSAEDLRALFDGAEAALVLVPDIVADPRFVANRSRMAHAIAGALREARVGHVVALSVVGADRDDLVGPPAGLHEFERLLSGLDGASVLVLRSVSYMDYLLASIPMIQALKVNGSAIRGDLEIPMIATADVAREAAERLARRDFTGHQVKLLLGPEDLTMREATRTLGARLGEPELEYVELPPAEVKGALLAAGMSEEAASLMVEMQLGVNRGVFFGGLRRTAETATPTRLQDFLRDLQIPADDSMSTQGGTR